MILATKNSNKRGVIRRASQNKAPEEKPVGIPPFISDPVLTWTSRFVVNDTTSTVTVTQELPIYPWGLSTSTTTMRLPFKAIRLNKIRIWGNYDSDLTMAANTISLTFGQRRLMRPMELSDCAAPFKLAYLEYKCKKTLPEGQWYVTRSGEANPDIIFRLVPGAVLDLTFNYILADSESVPLATSPSSGLTADLIYTNRMDLKLDPVGRANAAVIDY